MTPEEFLDQFDEDASLEEIQIALTMHDQLFIDEVMDYLATLRKSEEEPSIPELRTDNVVDWLCSLQPPPKKEIPYCDLVLNLTKREAVDMITDVSTTIEHIDSWSPHHSYAIKTATSIQYLDRKLSSPMIITVLRKYCVSQKDDQFVVS